MAGDADDHDGEGIGKALQKYLVLRQVRKVLQPNKASEHALLVHVGVGQTGDDADEHGDDDEAQEKDQTGQHEQVSRNVLTPLESLAHLALRLFRQIRHSSLSYT